MKPTTLKAEYIAIEKLTLHPDNPRIIKSDQFKVLCESLKSNPEYFETRPILANKAMVVFAGNMRLRAAIEIGLKEVPVVIMDITPEKERELMIRDNIQNGEWQVDILANNYDVEELAGMGLDVMDIFGKSITPLDLDEKIPEAKADPIAKRGFIYQLGRHRVMCGDATKITDINTLMGDVKADMIVTDPPYNVDYTGKTKDAMKIENDKMSDADFRAFLSGAFGAADKHLKPGGAFYIWHADSEGFNFRGACVDVGWKVRQCLIWNKNSMVMGRQDYHWKHEPCLYGWKEGASHNWYSDRTQTTVLEFDRPSESIDHPTMKPVELFAYQIGNNSKDEDVILDTFLGSGTTVVAAEKTNRTCYGLELDPRFVDVIVKRWEELTGEKAVLLSGDK